MQNYKWRDATQCGLLCHFLSFSAYISSIIFNTGLVFITTWDLCLSGVLVELCRFILIFFFDKIIVKKEKKNLPKTRI